MQQATAILVYFYIDNQQQYIQGDSYIYESAVMR